MGESGNKESLDVHRFPIRPVHPIIYFPREKAKGLTAKPDIAATAVWLR
jgi:hypothetical protein